VKDDGVESSRRCYALIMRLVGMSGRRLGHGQPCDPCPPTTSSIYSAARQGPTTMDRLASPIRARGETGMGLGPVPLGARWGQSNRNYLFSVGFFIKNKASFATSVGSQ
jgi:hypothetical protein